MTRTFTITPDGPFSLTLAASFGFGMRDGHETDGMRLAFVADDLQHHVGVMLRQTVLDGPIMVEVRGEADLAGVKLQVMRILSLDYSGHEWLQVGMRDKVIADFQTQYHGLRPVLFHSPYEAAAWSIISNRKYRAQATKIRNQLAEQLGSTFELGGQKVAAFPLPEQLLELKTFSGLDQTRVERLRTIAQAALDGKLAVSRLHSMTNDNAIAAMRELSGIGPFYAALIVIRASGLADVLPDNEPRFISFMQQLYGFKTKPSHQEIEAIAERWQPYRTWACVLIRYAGGHSNMEWTK